MYANALNHLNNVFIGIRSPRESGEREAISAWKEIKKLPFERSERIALIEKLAQEHSRVFLKTATFYGRARLFVSK